MTLGIKGIDRQLSSMETLQASYDLACLAIRCGVPGDFVECGVFHGSQCASMARAIMDTGASGRRVHLFDSFAGVPAPSEHDEEWIAARHPIGTSAASVQHVASNMRDWGIPPELLVYHVGWFEDTLPLLVGESGAEWFDWRCAILRIDGDLYSSTRTCLLRVYPRLSPGGWLVVDDFSLSGVRQACDEYFGCGDEYSPAYFQKVKP